MALVVEHLTNDPKDPGSNPTEIRVIFSSSLRQAKRTELLSYLSQIVKRLSP